MRPVRIGSLRRRLFRTSRNSEPEARRALGERLSESPARMRFTAVSAAESSWSHQQSLISIQSFSSPGPEGSQLPFPVGTEVRPQAKPLCSTGSGQLVRRCPVGEGHFLWSATRLKDLLPARGLDLASLTPRARAVCPGLASRTVRGQPTSPHFPASSCSRDLTFPLGVILSPWAHGAVSAHVFGRPDCRAAAGIRRVQGCRPPAMRGWPGPALSRPVMRNRRENQPLLARGTGGTSGGTVAGGPAER